MTTKKIIHGQDHATTKYAQLLVDKKICACEEEILLAKKHLRDLKRQGTKEFPYVFDTTRADRFFKHYENCYDYERGEYFKILDHLKFDFGLQYGWVRQDTGAFKHVEIYKQESRGNAKTTTSAIDCEYKLVGDRIYKPYQEKDFTRVINPIIQIMAVDSLQVEELREPIANIATHSPKIKPLVDVKKSYIKGKKFGGKIVVLSKDAKNKLGGKPYYIVIDEFAAQTNTSRISDTLKGIGKKEQAQAKKITTAGDYTEINPAKKDYDYGRKVLRGEIVDESFLPIIRQQDDESEIHKPALWAKSNPMLRYLPKSRYANTLFETIKREYEKAFTSNNTEEQRKFKIFRMDLWQESAINSYLKANDLKLLDECAVSQDEFKKLVKGKQCLGGWDFSICKDLSAGGAVWQLPDGRIAIDAFGYIPIDTIPSHEASDRIPYTEYKRQGWLHTTNYPISNVKEFAVIFCEWLKGYEGKAKELTYDPYKAGDVAIEFMEGKYDNQGIGSFGEKNVIEIPQNYRSLHIPTTKLRNEIRQKNIIWNGNPLLKWCFTNAFENETKTGGLIKIAKEHKDSNRRIDLVATIINALARIESLKDDAWVERMATMSSGFF